MYTKLSAAAFVFASFAIASASPSQPDYYEDVYPFLKANCISCHNKTTTKAGLNMETPKLMIQGGDSGPSIVPGNSEESLLVEASAHSFDLEMPPKNNKSNAVKLTSGQIDILKRWIDQGAKDSVQKQRKVTWKPLAPGVHPIYAVTMTKDGRFAACGRSNQISIYDLATRRFLTGASDPEEKDGAAHRALVQSLAFSDDGEWLASGGFRKVKIWRRTETKPVVKPAEPEIQKSAAEAISEKCTWYTPELYLVQSDFYTLSSDSKSVVTADKDKILRVWNPDANKPVELKGSAGTFTAITAGPGDLIATAGSDSKVRIWNIKAAKMTREIPRAGVVSLAFSPDGKSIVTGEAGGMLRVWDIASGKQTVELKGTVDTEKKIAELEWRVAELAVEQTHQNSEVAKIKARDKALDDLLKKAKDNIVAMNKKLPTTEKDVQPAKDARIAAEKAVADAEAKIAAQEEGKTDANLEKALVSAKDKLITEKGKETAAIKAVAAVKSNIADSEAQIKRITADKEGNAKDIATAEAAGAKAKADTSTANSELATIKKSLAAPGVKPLDLICSEDGGQIAGLFDDGTVRCWAVDTGRPVSLTKVDIEKAAGLETIENASFAVRGKDGKALSVISPPQWKLVKTLEEGFVDRINALVFSPDGKHLAIGGGEPSRSGNITIVDVANASVTASWKECHEDTVISLDFSNDGKLLASGSADKIARVYDVKTGEQVNLFEGHTHYVMDVTFRSDGRVLATAGADGIVNSWDLQMGEKKKKITGWNKEVTSIQFLGATNKMVASAGDNLIKILYDDGRLVRTIPGLPEFIQSVAGTPDGVTLVGGGEDSVLRVWDGTNSKELAKFGPN